MLKKNIYEYSGDYLAYFLLGSLRSVGPYLMGVLHIVPLNYKDGIRGLTFFWCYLILLLSHQNCPVRRIPPCLELLVPICACYLWLLRRTLPIQPNPTRALSDWRQPSTSTVIL